MNVQPGLGAWEGGGEATWVVAYRGNGEATRLLAETGKRYNQDGVLVLRAGGDAPVNETTFGVPLDPDRRTAVHSVLAAAGFQGWTWFRRGGQSVLRLACVPQWSGEPQAHMDSARRVLEALKERGWASRMTVRRMAVEVMNREGENSYDDYLG